MDKQKVIEYLEHAYKHLLEVKGMWLTVSEKILRYNAEEIGVLLCKAIEELKKPDANEERIRIKDEALNKAIDYIESFMIGTVLDARERLLVKTLKKAREA